ncbi:hypothetical protein [Lactobacillus crispatus]|jgi:hypothetical protein|uniref:Uncharacterized protein n=1 Tax=Lactobacillus crispatus TaxID=47770 RepID=A0AAW8WTL0_9LACO|nr:hypothetical protein [Lactobacillus crispatus]STX18335.1 Uncharacterised protein [Lactobacillus acidophilus]MCT7696867.1 hypothetical protein [Lactobacillus crispatus]MCT7708342.1 hypothetical protein [Lactobacillus crispatus]MCT7730901.1 hypothetical protein [Lactobacillus crispatus]MCT7802094.1 hypothetical protein [Lactobacillus crispatus]
MIRFTTKDCREFFSSDFVDLSDALSYVSNLKPSDSFYVDDYFDRRAKIKKSEIKTIGLSAEEEFIDDGDVDRKLRDWPTVDEMDINPDWMHINKFRKHDNIINLADYQK